MRRLPVAAGRLQVQQQPLIRNFYLVKATRRADSKLKAEIVKNVFESLGDDHANYGAMKLGSARIGTRRGSSCEFARAGSRALRRVPDQRRLLARPRDRRREMRGAQNFSDDHCRLILWFNKPRSTLKLLQKCDIGILGQTSVAASKMANLCALHKKSLTRTFLGISMVQANAGDPMTQTYRASSLPTFIMPCPYCGVRMIIKSVKPTLLATDLEDITHGCSQCGTELIRTVKPTRQSKEDLRFSQ